MKIKLFGSLLLVGALSASAQGYKDGIEYYNVGDLAEAQEILTRTLNDPATNQAEAYFYIGSIALKNGNVNDALKCFNDGIASNPDVAYNYIGLATIDLKNGNKDAAKDNFKQAEKLGKKDALVYTAIARAYHSVDPVTYKKEIDKAIEKAIKIDEHCAAIYILQAEMMAATGDINSAAGLFDVAMYQDKMDKEPAVINYPEGYVNYARTIFSSNPNLSIRLLNELLENQPNSALAQRELAEKYYDNHQMTMAAQEYGKYIQNPNHFKKDEIRYVQLLYFGKKYQESLDLSSKILAEDPNNFYMQRMQMLNKSALEDWTGAEAAAKTLFANPTAQFVANDYIAYGEVLQGLGQDTLAVEQYIAATKANPADKSLIVTLSGAYSKAKMYTEAAQAMQQYVDLGDYTVNDLFTLARRYQNVAATATDSLVRDSALTSAIVNLDMVIERVPNDFNPYYTKGRVLLLKNNSVADSAVVEMFTRTIELLNADPANLTKQKNTYEVCYNTLGNYFMEQGDMVRSKECFLKSLEIKDNPALREYIEDTFKED